jgi:hypothetical protein
LFLKTIEVGFGIFIIIDTNKATYKVYYKPKQGHSPASRFRGLECIDQDRLPKQ